MRNEIKWKMWLAVIVPWASATVFSIAFTFHLLAQIHQGVDESETALLFDRAVNFGVAFRMVASLLTGVLFAALGFVFLRRLKKTAPVVKGSLLRALLVGLAWVSPLIFLVVISAYSLATREHGSTPPMEFFGPVSVFALFVFLSGFMSVRRARNIGAAVHAFCAVLAAGIGTFIWSSFSQALGTHQAFSAMGGACVDDWSPTVVRAATYLSYTKIVSNHLWIAFVVPVIWSLLRIWWASERTKEVMHRCAVLICVILAVAAVDTLAEHGLAIRFQDERPLPWYGHGDFVPIGIGWAEPVDGYDYREDFSIAILTNSGRLPDATAVEGVLTLAADGDTTGKRLRDFLAQSSLANVAFIRFLGSNTVETSELFKAELDAPLLSFSARMPVDSVVVRMLPATKAEDPSAWTVSFKKDLVFTVSPPPNVPSDQETKYHSFDYRLVQRRQLQPDGLHWSFMELPPVVREKHEALSGNKQVERLPVYIPLVFDETSIELPVVAASVLFSLGFEPAIVMLKADQSDWDSRAVEQKVKRWPR